MDKKQSRQRRARRTRAKIRELGVPRLTVHRTPSHIYAQVIDSDAKVVASASSVLAEVRAAGATGNVTTAMTVGKMIAERTKEAGITRVAFDRSGFKYHGRVQALADAARENGLEF
ncbi:MAG: 50S ribosomal protein L18 [Gammaproteobacteria bacterium]|jgi:large subunit ribosomal protein L18|nr:50S ribosomal protein L18 [Gammaproteobacteria bacterium]MBT3489369.1 50S ribosomal protein L18 [Gammaproteobacteria bacterium]MBT3718298.1 50S ribosomal protein L18 [Gammaproteobacteria bacterium]MBT3844031.1 50S ribosomal protein L18 [Gammaproteobacteria bacterium]MBT3892175.1 50S ribosomal protein L18 [Gammaproteobacteria bacterium]